MSEYDGQLILRHHRKGPLEWDTVEGWEGGEKSIVDIRWLSVRCDCIAIEGNMIKAGPYILDIVDMYYGPSSVLVIRRNGFRTRIFPIQYKLKKLWLQIYHRLILTAWVWELADHEPGMIPGWQDLKFIKWLKSND